MNKISMMGFVVMAVLGGGCDVESQMLPSAAPSAATSAPVCARTKTFERISAGMSYFDAVAACAEAGGSLARPVGTAEQQEFARVCREGLYNPRCWSAYTTADAAISSYAEDLLGVPVCEVWK